MMRNTERTQLGEDAIWLVKTADRVIGPFTTVDVYQKLRAREIVIIDEIMAPLSRWRYVREEPRFAAVVEEIRKSQMVSREDTEIQTHAPTPDTQTDTENAQLPANLASSPDSSAAVTEIAEPIERKVNESEKIETLPTRPRPPENVRKVRQYALEPAAHHAGNTANRKLVIATWCLAVIVLLGVGYVVMQARNLQAARSPTETVEDFDGVLALAARAWDRGEFDDSLKLYRRAHQTQPQRLDVTGRLATLMLRLDGQTVEAKRLLQETQPYLAKASLEQKRGIDLAMGLAALQSEEWADASESFARAKSNTDDDWVIEFDSGVASLKGKTQIETTEHLRAAGDRPVAQLMKAKAIIASGENSLQEAEQAIEKIVSHQGDFLQEALVVGAFVDISAGNRKLAATHVIQALDVDPLQTENHFHDPRLAMNDLAWLNLEPMCRKLSDELKSSHARALLAICLAKSERRDEAFKIIEEELVRNTGESLIQSVNAYLLLSVGRDADARGALRIAMKGEVPRLAKIVQARVCDRAHDAACATEQWTKLSTEEHPPLAALVALSQLRAASGDTKGAAQLLGQAETISPTYLPVIRARQGARE